MDRIVLQTHLDNLFIEALPHLYSPAHFCWFRDQIRIEPADHTLDIHHAFFELNTHHLKHGLLSCEWDLVTDKIFNFFEEKKKCQKQSEH